MTPTANQTVTIEVPALKVDPARYLLWLRFCHRYRVTGRVVCRHWRWDGHILRFCDEPVPAAKVEIFDVDCFWWFCKKDLITTATTDPDGTFEAEFWWCCSPWFPWFPDLWAVDPDLLTRFRRLLDAVRVRIPIPLPDPPPDPRGLEPYLHLLSAALDQAERRPPTSLAEAQAIRLPETEIVKRLPPAPELEALHVWPWWPVRDCAADLLFRVTQECQGVTQVIHSESVAQTRWNAPTALEVTLLANEKACCIPICEDPPCGDCFKWAEVRCTPVKIIGGNDPLNPVAAELLGLAYPGGADIAFARTLPISGVFGSLSDVEYYEIEYSRDGLPFVPLPNATLANFVRIFWGPPCAGGIPQWNTVPFPVQAKQDTGAMTHHVYETREHYEKGCGPGSWGLARFWTSHRDQALVWVTATTASGPGGLVETPLLPDGLYRLRVIGYMLDGAGKLTNPQVMLRCDTAQEEHLTIRLDNRTVPDHAPFAPSHPCGPGFVHICSVDPDCDFLKLVLNEGKGDERELKACDIGKMKDSDTLTVHFSVTVPGADTDRHLGGYWMNVHHGESAVFNAITASATGVQPDPTLHVGPTYAQALAQGESRRWWGGGSYKLILPGSAFPETCAYLFRLHAWKRVFDGCGPIEWFHWNDAEFSITIEKH